nr:hypothetical protein [Tanacetum cinerariifolium]
MGVAIDGWLSLQHLPLSPAIFSHLPGRYVAGDTHPERHVTLDKLKGKARQGFVLGRHSQATLWGHQVLILLFELFDIAGVVRALRRGRKGRNEDICGPSRQYPTNTGKVPPLLALSSQGIDLFFSVGQTRRGVGAYSLQPQYLLLCSDKNTR